MVAVGVYYDSQQDTTSVFVLEMDDDGSAGNLLTSFEAKYDDGTDCPQCYKDIEPKVMVNYLNSDHWANTMYVMITYQMPSASKDIHIFLGNFEELNNRELSFFKINLPSSPVNHKDDDYRIAFTSNWDSGPISFGIISRKPGYYYLALFELDLTSKVVSLKNVVTE